MKDTTMLEALSAIGAKLAGLKGFVGVVGAAMLYMVMPVGPKVSDGTVIVDAKAYQAAKRKETAVRFAFAFMASEFGGEWFVDFLSANAAWLQSAKHPIVFVGLFGALGWYAGRWVALWLYKHQDTGIDQVVKDVKELLP